LRVLVADDEAIERRVICQVLSSRSEEIESVNEAKNGREAVSLALEEKPQLIFMDIRMPGLDGLEAAKQILTRYKTRIIFISAHQDFSYAQQALRAGATDYILKPVRPETLLDLTRKVRQDLCREENTLRWHSELKAQLDQILPLAEHDLVYRLIWGRETEQSIRQKANILGLSALPSAALAVSIKNQLQHNNEREIFQRKAFLYNTAKESIIDIPASLCAPTGNTGVVILLPAPLEGVPPAKEKTILLARRISENIKKKIARGVTMGIGRHRENPLEIGHSYTEAVTALQFGFFRDDQPTIHIDEVFGRRADQNIRAYPLNLENTLLSLVVAGDTNAALESLNQLFEYMTGSGLPPDQIIARVSELVALISRNLLETLTYPSEESCDLCLTVLPQIYTVKSIIELKDLTEAAVAKACGKILLKAGNRYSELVNEVLEILQNSYNLPFSLEELAKKVYRSPAYISKIFSQEVGLTLTQYLTSLRINKARELLSANKANRLTINQIAFIAGYSDPNYFSRIFRKITGSSPKTYQSLKRDNRN